MIVSSLMTSSRPKLDLQPTFYDLLLALDLGFPPDPRLDLNLGFGSRNCHITNQLGFALINVTSWTVSKSIGGSNLMLVRSSDLCSYPQHWGWRISRSEVITSLTFSRPGIGSVQDLLQAWDGLCCNTLNSNKLFLFLC